MKLYFGHREMKYENYYVGQTSNPTKPGESTPIFIKQWRFITYMPEDKHKHRLTDSKIHVKKLL